MRLKPLPKLLLIVSNVGGLVWGFANYGDKIMPKGRTGNAPFVAKNTSGGGSNAGDPTPIRVNVVTWGGYAGGQYFNGGFSASKDSRYFKEYGILVEFVLNDDPDASIEAWKGGAVDVHWWAFDSFSPKAAGLSQFDPRFIFAADYSRGGDVCVATRGISNVSDLRGKRVAVAFGTPSHTGLLNMLKAGDVNYHDIVVVEAPSAVDAASYFKAGTVDAAMVWSPDDEGCMANVNGARRLWTTRDAPYVISDGFFCKADYARTHQRELKALVEGWLRGAAEINSSSTAREEAAQILSAGLNQPLKFCRQAISNVRLCTYGDNVNLFNLDGGYSGVKAEDMYFKTGSMFQEIGLLAGTYPSWRQISDASILRSINLVGPEHAAEGSFRFARADAAAQSAPAFATKRLTINFPSGSSTLDDNAKTIIDLGFGDIAKNFASMRIRIEGNTDNVGELSMNMRLSEARAQAVAEYLTRQYAFDPNRFVVVGNGPNSPVASNDAPEGRAKNRRTDFELLSR